MDLWCSLPDRCIFYAPEHGSVVRSLKEALSYHAPEHGLCPRDPLPVSRLQYMMSRISPEVLEDSPIQRLDRGICGYYGWSDSLPVHSKSHLSKDVYRLASLGQYGMSASMTACFPAFLIYEYQGCSFGAGSQCLMPHHSSDRVRN